MDEETTLAFNSLVKSEWQEAKGHNENPRLVNLLRLLVRFTNTAEQNEEMDSEENPMCPHTVVNRLTGKCVACGEEPDAEESEGEAVEGEGEGEGETGEGGEGTPHRRKRRR